MIDLRIELEKQRDWLKTLDERLPQLRYSTRITPRQRAVALKVNEVEHDTVRISIDALEKAIARSKGSCSWLDSPRECAMERR